MKPQTCNCHPYSPFHYKNHPRPSIFLRDFAFRAKGVVVTETGSYFTKEAEEEFKTKAAKEKELTAYKEFGIFTRAIQRNQVANKKKARGA